MKVLLTMDGRLPFVAAGERRSGDAGQPATAGAPPTRHPTSDAEYHCRPRQSPPVAEPVAATASQSLRVCRPALEFEVAVAL